MSVQDSPAFEAFLYFILVVKILFLISMLLSIYASHKGTQAQADKYENFQEKMEHLFIICMGILMMILYFPHSKGPVCVDGHTKLFLYIFGILSVLGIIKNFRKQHSSHPDQKKVEVSFTKSGTTSQTN
jgi:cell division protein FtsW (lipid II flippase)